MRVLYVEDNEVNQALVARVMRAKQCEVLFREEGESALEVLAEDAEIDLVLLDIELAGAMSGLDVIRTLRAHNDRRPVVAITAYAMMGDRERILEAGCDQYLPKPVVIPDLLKLLEDYEQEFAAPVTVPLKPYQPARPAEEAPPAAEVSASTAEPVQAEASPNTAETESATPAAMPAAAESAQPAGTTPAESTPAASDATRPEGETATGEHESTVPVAAAVTSAAANAASAPHSGPNGTSNGVRAANDAPVAASAAPDSGSESAPAAPPVSHTASGGEEPVEDKRHE